MKITAAFSFIIVACLAIMLQASAQPVEILPPEFHGAIQPQIAVTKNGNIFVAFGKESSIYCVTSTDGAKIFHAPVKIATLPKLALGMRRGPRIAATTERVTVSAISHETGNLYAWTSDDAGSSWSSGAPVNEITNSAREGLHAMASDGRGNLCATWLDCRDVHNQLWGAVSHDGGKTWGKNVPVYRSPEGHICECCHPSAEYLPDGKIRAMWRNLLNGSRDMYLAESSDGGATFGPGMKCGDGTWSLNACPMDGGSMAGDYTTWMRAGSVYYTGGDLAEHLLDAHGRQPVVALGRAGGYFIWQNGSQLLLKAGLAASPTVLAQEATYPSMAAASEKERPVVVWEAGDPKTIFAQILP